LGAIVNGIVSKHSFSSKFDVNRKIGNLRESKKNQVKFLILKNAISELISTGQQRKESGKLDVQ
jgi:hypothetical protein